MCSSLPIISLSRQIPELTLISIRFDIFIIIQQKQQSILFILGIKIIYTPCDFYKHQNIFKSYILCIVKF